MEVKESKVFKSRYFTIGWNFEQRYLLKKCEIISADTETKLYYNNEILTEQKAYQLANQKDYKGNSIGQQFIRENVEVRAYAYTMSDGNNFALFTEIEDFLLACCLLKVKVVFWYNAKFDFAIFDYYFLTNEWKNFNERIGETKHYGKLSGKTYSELNGDFGQRYSMRIWYDYIDNKYRKAVHNFKMYDICNIYSGGLAKNLKDFDIRDKDGNAVRKLEMNYVECSIEEDLQYMINDTKGLALLSKKINDTMLELTGFSLYNGDYITAGGLAKKSLLKEMYGGKPKENIAKFKGDFVMTVKADTYYRENGLYKGGIALVNPYKIGVVQKGIYKYDVNSMYPNKMRNMRYPYGIPQILKVYNKNDERVKVLCIYDIDGKLKENKIPIWYDNLVEEYVSKIWQREKLLIWEEELQEIEKWYDLKYKVKFVQYYDGKECIGAKNFVDKFYKIKCESTGCVRQGAKLELNSAYGKLAQRIDRPTGEYELSEQGYVHYVRTGVEIDEKGMLSVLVGSRITALARVSLLQYTRLICQENVKDNFIYCDTDSVHALKEYTDTDSKALGKMKNEGYYIYGLYLAPKTYIMYDDKGEYEVHCKGVNTKVVAEELKGKTFRQATNIFTANRTFKCLCGINVKGGKALVYIDKMIMNDSNYKCESSILDTDEFIFNGD